MRQIFSFAAICLAAMAAAPVSAGVISITDAPAGRATFGGNDIVDWGVLGPEFTSLSNPFSTTSTGGVGLTVSQTSNSFERRNLATGWGGNFTDGSVLLWTGGDNANPMTLAFSSLIAGVGFQINPNFSETTTLVEVFGAGDVSFGAFVLTTNDRNQASADFIGFKSSATDIAKITISQSARSDFAINQLSLVTGPSTTVPEPGSMLLAGLALAALVASRRSMR